ncbi:MAG: AAA family ATPase, partial [bacterium]|nr:AAA family ATPase [bacterium]
EQVKQETGLSYSAMQQEAIKQSLLTKITIITGGPGTGKTTIIRALIKMFIKRKLRIRLASPTGRAAKRMEEACNYPASTIHRMLEFNPRENKFMRDIMSPLDIDVLIVDESSMIDTSLMASLLNGTPLTARIIFVGDSDQLPSVGPGCVLKDMIDSGRIPVVMLDTIFRQAETSDIIVNAHAINSGEVPKIDNTTSKNFFFLK